MKFSSILKVVGAGALLAGLVPKVKTDDKTGELRMDALLWSAAKDSEGNVSVSLLPKLHDRCCCSDDELEDLFDDDVVIEYTAGEMPADEAPVENSAEEEPAVEDTPAEEEPADEPADPQ